MNSKRDLKQRIIDRFGEPSTLDELAETVIKVINAQVDRKKNHITVAGFAWDINYRDVSNTHDCPIDGKSNWGGRTAGAPRSYKGYTGRVWIRYAKPFDDFGSDPFKETLTYPGTGGWGSYDGPFEEIAHVHYIKYGSVKIPKDAYPEPQVYSWDYRFYEDDWPLVKTNREKEIVMSILSNKPTDVPHKFEWQDPEIIERDHEFIRSTKNG